MNENGQAEWHYLRPLTSAVSPTHWIFFDTETFQVQHPHQSGVQHHHLRCWVMRRVLANEVGTGGVRVLEGTTAPQFWDALYHLIGTHGRPVIVAHNLAFDLGVVGFWERLESGEFQFEVERPDEGNAVDPEGESAHKTGRAPILSDPPTIIPGQLRGRRCVLVDSYNLFRTSVEEMGRTLSQPKLPLPAEDAPVCDWLDRCRVDVDILTETVMGAVRLCREQLQCPWRHTAAGLAWSFFRRHFLPAKTFLVHREPSVLAMERWAYYGGEVWTGWIGRVEDSRDSHLMADIKDGMLTECRPGPVYELDVNSFYPWLMSSFAAPCKIVHKGTSIKLLAREVAAQKKTGCAVVRIDSPTWALPVRIDLDTLQPLDVVHAVLHSEPPPKRCRTIYATGQFWTALCGQELALAIQEGWVKEVFLWSLYDNSDALQRCADWLIKLRQQSHESGNRPLERLVKLISNSLFGKFGQWSAGWRHCPEVPPAVLWGEWCYHDFQAETVRHYRSLAGTVQALGERCEGAQSMPIVSAAVTAAGRVCMRLRRNAAGTAHVIYQDTDSLHVDGEGLTQLDRLNQLNDSQAGCLKIVGTHTTAQYCGAKHYRVGETWCVAGLKKRATQLSDAIWVQREWERMRTVLNASRPGVPRSYTRTLRLSLCHPTGRMLGNGQVVPWHIEPGVSELVI